VGLAGRRFGTVVTWFLLGGDLYTAYTFIAVPALVYGAGALGLFSLPLVVIAFPLLFMAMPRLWKLARDPGYVTSADLVGDQYRSRSLALAIAFTGILATLPYIALQLVGMQVVLAALGLSGDLPLLLAFVILAGYTYFSGLRAPAMIAVVNDVLIYMTVVAAVIVVPARGNMFFVLADSEPAAIVHDEARKDFLPGPELGTALPIVTSRDTLAIKVPVLDILGSDDFTTCGQNTTGGSFDCSSGHVVAEQEKPFYFPEVRIEACVVFGSGHDLSVSLNHRVPVTDSVAWSLAFVGQRGFENEHRTDRPANNCG
jgi:hypothetical protein